MATPASFPNPAREDSDLKDEKAQFAYEHGHDVDHPAERQTQISLPKDHDLEKGTRSNLGSSHSDEQTLSEENLAREAAEERDPNIVDWDGPDDPKNPMNWPASRKWTLIAALAGVTLVTYVGIIIIFQCFD